MPATTTADPLPLAARLGQLPRMLAWLLAVLVLTQALQIAARFDDGSGLRQLQLLPLVVLLGFGLSALLHWAGTAMLDGALRHRAANAASVLAADPRPPVLYLRPFDEDLRQARASGGLRLVPAPAPGQSAEQLIARVLGGIGPLVAVGRPGEALPPLGFARLYVADDGWQGAVAGLLGRAAAVVLVAGSSKGLMWELEQAARHVPRSRLVLIVPAWPGHDFDVFRQCAQARLGMQLPPLDSHHRGPFPHGIRAWISFGPAGRPMLHAWDWDLLPAAERGACKRALLRWFGGRGLPAYALLDGLVAQWVDQAVGHLLRPHGIAAPTLVAAKQVAAGVAGQARLARAIALLLALVVVAGVLVVAATGGH